MCHWRPMAWPVPLREKIILLGRFLSVCKQELCSSSSQMDTGWLGFQTFLSSVVVTSSKFPEAWSNGAPQHLVAAIPFFPRHIPYLSQTRWPNFSHFHFYLLCPSRLPDPNSFVFFLILPVASLFWVSAVVFPFSSKPRMNPGPAMCLYRNDISC